MASGKIVGTCKGGNPTKYSFWIEWSSTANIAENYSILNAAAYVQRNDGYKDSAYDLTVSKNEKSISVDGEKTYATSKGVDTRNSQKFLVAKVASVKIPHGEDGQKTITISAEFSGMGSDSLKSGFASKEVALDPIDVTPPQFSVQPYVFDLTQTSASVSFETPDIIDKIEYSIDGQNTWVEVAGNPFEIVGLSAYTSYYLYVKIRESSNQKESISTAVEFKTKPIYVTDISVQPSFRIDIGETIDIPFSVEPENASVKSVTITSSNPEIISAAGSKITGHKKGDVVLTVLSDDGGGASATISASTARRVTGISIYPDEITIAKGSSVELAINIYPSDADNKNVVLTSSDESLLSVSGLTITAIENGVAEVTARTVDGGFTAKSTITIVGEYTWYDYSKPIEVLNSEDVNHIYSNMRTIRSMLLATGRDVEQLNDTTARKNMPYIEMFALFQNIEYNFDKISNNDCMSIYYGDSAQLGDYAPNTNDIWRWIQILNEMYLILTGSFGKWQYALLSDGYPTINGKRLLIRGEKVG
jgi:uncharacterized protein YjdB